jgi:hypothetical protein
VGVLHAVVELDQTISEAFGREQAQGHLAVTPCDQWDAVPNEDWCHTDDELVDCLRARHAVSREEPA